MMKAYGGVLIVTDVLLLLLKLLYYIVEGIYRLFVPVEEKSVAGEIVLVTGAGHGIGKELALKYASLGATVVCWDLNQRANDETVEEIKQLGAAKAYGYKCDVSNREEVLKVAEKVKEDVGNVTILINNAGIMPCRTFLDHSPEEIKRMFDVNVMAHFWTLQAFLPSMIQNNHGHIVALSSIAGILGIPNLAPYCASKYAVRGLMEGLDEELRRSTKDKPSNIKFTTIYPYMVDTGLCKKPQVRFPSILPLVPPKMAADEIVRTQRRNIRHVSIPWCLMRVNFLFKCLPEMCAPTLLDFLGSGVEADS